MRLALILRMHFSRLMFGLLAAFLLSGLANAVEPAKRPNFVFIVSEDNSIHYLRLYGNKLGITPNIERLAAEGLTFNHACLLYTSPSPRDATLSRMPSSA